MISTQNASLARLAEARALAGRVGTTCREIAGLLVAYVDEDRSTAPLVQLAARHLCAVPWGIKRVVRGGADAARFAELLGALLPAAEVGPLLAAPLPPLASVGRLRAIVQHVHGAGRLDRAAHRTIEGRLGALNDVVGACERLAQSPVPPAYTRHTSRMLLIFLVLVPVGLMDLRLKVQYVASSTLFITRGPAWINAARVAATPWSRRVSRVSRRRRGVVATTPWSCRDDAAGLSRRPVGLSRRRGAADANRPQVPRRRHRGGRHRARGALHVVPAAGVGRPRDGRRRGRGLPAPPRAAALDVSRGRRRRVVGLPRRLICVYSLYSLCIVHECERPAPDICVCRYPSLTRANRPQASSWVAAPGSGCPRSRR